jgi:hypothetical protein
MSVVKKKPLALSVRENLTDLELLFWLIVTPILTWDSIKRRVFNSRLLRRHIQKRCKMKIMRKTKKV